MGGWLTYGLSDALLRGFSSDPSVRVLQVPVVPAYPYHIPEMAYIVYQSETTTEIRHYRIRQTELPRLYLKKK